jgi:hypothetical protein
MRWIQASLILSAIALMSGCDAGGAAMYQFFGADAVPAQYVPPKQPTLVLVENYRIPGGDESDDDLIAQEVGDELKEHKVVPLVDLDKLVMIRDSDPEKFRARSILDLGRAVGAGQVVYVDVTECQVQTDSSLSAIAGKVAVRVRVVDVASGETRWPLDSAQGHPISIEIPFNRADPDKADSMHAELIAKLSDSIAKLFYSWQPDSNEQGDGSSS